MAQLCCSHGALLVQLPVLMARSSCCSLGARGTLVLLTQHTPRAPHLGARGTVLVLLTQHTPRAVHWVHIAHSSCCSHSTHLVQLTVLMAQSSCCSRGARGTLVLLTLHTPHAPHLCARGTLLVLLTLHTPRAAHWLHTAHPSCRPCAAACTHSVPHGARAAPHFLHPQQRPGAAAAPQCALRSRRAIRRGRGGEGRAGGRRPQRFPGAEAALCGH